MSTLIPIRITITFDEASSGVACDLNSRGFHVLCKATKEEVGHVKPYSITGTLPLIRDLQVHNFFFQIYLFGLLKSQLCNILLIICWQDEGFDVQTSGYGTISVFISFFVVASFSFSFVRVKFSGFLNE